MKTKLAIFGTAGHALEIADIADALGMRDILLLSREASAKAPLPVRPEDEAQALAEAGYQFVVGIANPQIKSRVAETFSDLPYINLIHPAATFGRGQRALLPENQGIVIAAGAVLMHHIRIGKCCAIGPNTTIGHDCELEDYVSIMPGANVSGNVVLQTQSYIGTGAAIIQGSPDHKKVIGAGATVGAGAVVTRNVADGTTVVGSPARVLA